MSIFKLTFFSLQISCLYSYNLYISLHRVGLLRCVLFVASEQHVNETKRTENKASTRYHKYVLSCLVAHESFAIFLPFFRPPSPGAVAFDIGSKALSSWCTGVIAALSEDLQGCTA